MQHRLHERAGMKRSISMPELSEIREIIEFDTAIEVLNKENVSPTKRDGMSSIPEGYKKKHNPKSFNHSQSLPPMHSSKEIMYEDNDNEEPKADPVPFLTDDESENEKDLHASTIKTSNIKEKESDKETRKSLFRSSSHSDIHKLKKRVQFSNREVREYKITLGDHPDAVGVPIALSWEYVEKEKEDIESYESSRGPRRSRDTLVMSLSARKQLLLDQGFLKHELREAAKEVKKVQKERKFSEKVYPVYDAGYAIRSVAKSMKKSIVHPKKESHSAMKSSTLTS